ncbi:hypothetical protein FHL15_001713 [Xylaria flabelliformis]|uniref:Phosphoglycerate mutase-like protein n=1 Tax=Xylaria flabelliformis TaxID=2512241 RepID=A0A553IB70_9PEZI|nr:hypothetical protein FHL15_001713 [Xylaria flabelliformis]
MRDHENRAPAYEANNREPTDINTVERPFILKLDSADDEDDNQFQAVQKKIEAIVYEVGRSIWTRLAPPIFGEEQLSDLHSLLHPETFYFRFVTNDGNAELIPNQSDGAISYNLFCINIVNDIGLPEYSSKDVGVLNRFKCPSCLVWLPQRRQGVLLVSWKNKFLRERYSTCGWVDEELKETLDGDEQPVGRILEFLDGLASKRHDDRCCVAMRLLLVRHGESVDNVAGLYAGSRDSPLTNHGVLQAKRLGAHVASRRAIIGPVRHIFASSLQRAYQTAEAVADACETLDGDDISAISTVIRVEELREKDFGLSEGKKFGTREDVDGSESPVSMRLRIDRFLDYHLSPIIDQLAAENATVVIVAHGIILNVLLKALLSRYPLKSASLPMGQRPGSEYQAPWSNTGFLQAILEPSSSNAPPQLHIRIELTNNVDHLQGLKKTRGGIGSAKFDSKQRTMDSFFGSASRKRKTDDAED